MLLCGCHALFIELNIYDCSYEVLNDSACSLPVTIVLSLQYLQELLDATHQQMLSWAQFELTCTDMKSVISDVQEMASRDEISQTTDLESLLNPKFDVLAKKKRETAELKKTDTWKEHITKVNAIG